MIGRTIYSFVVDEGPAFARQGWHLAKSIRSHCGAAADDIHVQATDRVEPIVVSAFAHEGYRIHRIARFGDGRWCNKLAQLPNLLGDAFDVAVLLDTDMIVVADIRPFLRVDAVLGKIVDFANPPLTVLLETYRQAGGRGRPRVVKTDAIDSSTVLGNCNGGFYAVPRQMADHFSSEWRRWALWLLEAGGPLHRAGRLRNVDQVSAALAFSVSGVPFGPARSNVNYFLHTQAPHSYLDPSRPIAVLHYHSGTLGPDGQIRPPFAPTRPEAIALRQANAQIASGGDDAVRPV